MTDTIYTALKNAGCLIDNHYSDLYVQDTEIARSIILDWVQAGRLSWKGYSYFLCRRTNTSWIDIPFAFDPFWVHQAVDHLQPAFQPAYA